MAYIKIKLANITRKKMESQLDFNTKKGDLAAIKRISAILSLRCRRIIITVYRIKT